MTPRTLTARTLPTRTLPTRMAAAGLGCALVAALLSLTLHAPAWVRVAPMLLVLVIMPGIAISRHLGDGRQKTPAAVPIAVGIAWLVLASEALVYSHWWKPVALIPATVAVSGIALAVPTYRAAHRVRIGRLCLALAISFAGVLLAPSMWTMFRAPYTADELRPLQAAWTWSQNTAGQTGRLPLSAMSFLEAAFIPFGHPSTGTLLATRWLGIGLLLASVATASGWSRAFVHRRGAAATVALLASTAGVAFVARLSDVAVVGAPLLLGAGWCLVGPTRSARRLQLGGAMLGAAGLSSRQCAFAGLGLLLWMALDDGQRRRASPNHDDGVPLEQAALGILFALVAGLLGAAAAGVSVPALATDVSGWRAVPVRAHFHASFLACVPLVFVVQVGLLREATSAVRRGRRVVVRRSYAPMLALAGSCIGAFLERAALTRVVLLPLLLVVLCAANVLWPNEDADVAGVDGLRRGADGSVRFVARRVGLTAVLIIAPLAAQIADVWGSTNTEQVARVAYLLRQNAPSPAILDLTAASLPPGWNDSRRTKRPSSS